MDLNELPVVPAYNIASAVHVSKHTGKRVLDELVKANRIKPVYTSTGRTLLTLPDARRLFEALVAG